MVQTALGDCRAAEAALRRAVETLPTYAPAVLSLGSVEYQRRRRAAGRKLFLSLLTLPEDTTDLCEIIDEAGDFLIGRHDYKDGLELYRGAVARFPNVAVFHQGLGCCAGHQGCHDEAVAAGRRSVELEPANQKFVNDLGWSLLEAGRLEEAEETLKRAVSMDPEDKLARENLRWCQEKLGKGKSRRVAPARRRRAAARKRRGAGKVKPPAAQTGSLFEGVDGPVDEEAEAAWAEEIARRVRELDSGAKTIPKSRARRIILGQ
jgi:Flp pilus assembly protein TadD